MILWSRCEHGKDQEMVWSDPKSLVMMLALMWKSRARAWMRWCAAEVGQISGVFCICSWVFAFVYVFLFSYLCLYLYLCVCICICVSVFVFGTVYYMKNRLNAMVCFWGVADFRRSAQTDQTTCRQWKARFISDKKSFVAFPFFLQNRLERPLKEEEWERSRSHWFTSSK